MVGRGSGLASQLQMSSLAFGGAGCGFGLALDLLKSTL